MAFWNQPCWYVATIPVWETEACRKRRKAQAQAGKLAKQYLAGGATGGDRAAAQAAQILPTILPAIAGGVAGAIDPLGLLAGLPSLGGAPASAPVSDAAATLEDYAIPIGIGIAVLGVGAAIVAGK